MSNPLESLSTAANDTAQKVVRGIVQWGFGAQRYGSQQAGKTDISFSQKPMDTLRRAAYNNVFGTLFMEQDKFPYLTPDKTIKNVIGKLANNIFMRGTTITHTDETTNKLIQQMITDVKWNLKVENTVEEAALMGYCGIRSVWSKDLQKWLYEVKQKEYLIIETIPGVPDEITAVGLEWPVERKSGNITQRFWKKERWTKEVYQEWPEKAETPNGKPEFLPGDAITEANIYGEIPYTIVPHLYDACKHGVGVVNDEEILSSKCLIRLRHKRHYGHLKYMDPNPVRTNHATPGEPLDMNIGVVIDLTQADEKTPTELKLLEFAGMPESVKDEFYDHVKAIYAAAGLKAPSPDEAMKTGGTQITGIGLRIRDKDDCDTIETLRDNGYSQVVRHFEKMLRMGARIGLPEYSGINPDNPETFALMAKYPAFFQLTDEEINTKLSNFDLAGLPPEIKGPMVAALFGIEDQTQIDLIIKTQQDKADLLTAGPSYGPGGKDDE